MVQYTLECIGFQLAFLIIYDFFLKWETFFQWNRVYLIGTYILSLALPWVKIEALRTTVPEDYYVYPEFLLNANALEFTAETADNTIINFGWQQGLLYGGMMVAALYFAYKLIQLYQLSKNGHIEHFPNFTRVVIKNSELAFSFFRSIFLGDKILEREHSSIIKHELVHIEQRHTLDLLFFELMRIVGWFNPLVYVYQNRISELHEFIADAQVPKAERKAHYDLLLSQIFKTQNISFVNQFFKSSLIKKRIVMLQKSKSKRIFQLKYLLLLPLVFGMLGYSALETKEGKLVLTEQTPEDKVLIFRIEAEIENEIAIKGSFNKVFFDFHNSLKIYSEDEVLNKEMYFKQEILDDRRFTMYMDSLEKAKTPFVKRDKSVEKRTPSTARYQSYVQHTKAFQILDKNLKYSIENRFGNGGTSIKFLDENKVYSKNLLVFEVVNVKDLTGDEVKNFNNNIAAIFETKKSNFKGIVLTDGEYSFEVFNLNLEENEIITNLISEKSPVIPFAEVEHVPIFPGCENDADSRGCFFENMRKHIRKNFSYPKEAQERGIQGRVNTMFIIDEEGNIINPKFRGPDSLLTNEAERIVRRLPRMQPGEHKGEKVQVAFSIPITFKLNSNKSEEEIRQKNYDNESYVPFAVINEVPVFPGCEDTDDKRACFNQKMMAHISKNFQYPQEAQDKGIQGMVNIIFTIGADGVVKNLKMRGPDALLENEAKRIVALLPKMAPGKQKGKKVDVPYSIPISFRLESSDSKSEIKDKSIELGMGLTSNDKAIFFLDGVETTMEYIQTINPDAIESVNVLKGKTAEDKYGEKGKNGIIEITLKQKD